MPRARAETALYATEAEVARMLLPEGRRRDWHVIADLLPGFPPVDPLMGGRYVPAIRAWCDRRHGLGQDAPMPADGVENLGSWRKTKRRA